MRHRLNEAVERRRTRSPRRSVRRKRPGGPVGKKLAGALACLALVLSQVLGLWGALALPEVAFASQEGKTVVRGFTGSGLPHGWFGFKLSGGTLGGCIDPGFDAPGQGQTFVVWDYVGESQVLHCDPHAMGYAAMLFAQEDAKGSFVEPGSALTVTCWAMVDGAKFNYETGKYSVDDFSGNYAYCGGNIYNPKAGTNPAVKEDMAIVERIVAEAKQHAGEAGPWDYSARVWHKPEGNDVQNILEVLKDGELKLTKTSSSGAWTSGNDSYGLEGAVYEVFDSPDEAGQERVATLTTKRDGSSDAVRLAPGTYYVSEKEASEGHVLCDGRDGAEEHGGRLYHRVTVEIGATASFECVEPACYDPAFLQIKKVDVQTGKDSPQGDASLEGTVFEVAFHKTQGDVDGRAPEAVWYLRTDEAGRTSLQLAKNNPAVYLGSWNGRASSDLYLDPSGTKAVLPLGTVTVREVAAPAGYTVADQATGVYRIGRTGTGVEVDNGVLADKSLVKEQVLRGGIRLQKLDRELAEPGLAQGGATLAGAVFEVTSESSNPVVVGGKTYGKGDVVATMRTDAEGKASTSADALPYGTYSVREVEAPKGYRLNEGWVGTARVREAGAIVTVEGGSPSDQVFRGDLSLVKAEEDSQRRMAGVAFLIESTTTGEAHVAVTDENGMLDTSASWLPHSQRTNANDAALADGRIDDSRLDAGAGVWFSGSAGSSCTPDDGLGALPYDTYEVRELRCRANEGMRLAAPLTVRVSRDGVKLDVGTVDNKRVGIRTTLTHSDGGKTCPALGTAALKDTVAFENLEAGHEYLLEGELHAVASDGSDLGVVSRSEKRFSSPMSSGTVDIDFALDMDPLDCASLVAFEALYDGNDLLASHADLEDEGQTVRIPRIRTEMMGDLEHEADAEDLALTDVVRYEGLEPGREYELLGTLRERDGSGEGTPLLDADGEAVASSVAFTPDAHEGTVEVSFDLTGCDLAGKTLVAFEELAREGTVYAVHRDIADEGQTVRFPSVATEAVADETGDHVLPDFGKQRVVDTVRLGNLVVGRTYDVAGALHLVTEDGTDGGTVAEGSASFTAEATEQEVEIEFEVDAEDLAGKTLVAFEELSRGGVRLGSHADLGDKGQTVYIPAIGTALAGADGEKELVLAGDGDEALKLVDTVSYENLVPGREYRLEGSLRLKARDGSEEGPCLDPEGNESVAEATFTPDEPNGSVEVEFAIDARGLDGHETVAFERLFLNETQVAAHEDISDEGQTVRFSAPPEEPEAPEEGGDLPKTGDISLPAVAIGVLGSLLAFTAWAIVRAGSMYPDDEY